MENIEKCGRMTDNEIIKALKEILEIMLTMGDLQKAGTISKTLDLINRQKAEIERLSNTVAILSSNVSGFAEEIDRHRKDKDEAFLFAASIVESENIIIAQAKAEAVKEFAERLKEQFPKNNHWVRPREIVDNLVKETVGDNNA